MDKKNNFWLMVVAAAMFGLLGCDSSSEGAAGMGGAGGTAGTGGTAGMGGDGGTGGMAGEGAMVTAVHLAPEVPSVESTEVAIFVNGSDSGVAISYGESTGRIPLPAGTYDLGLGLPGGDAPLLELSGVELVDGDDLTIVAYRTNDVLPVNVFVFSNSTDGLAEATGRVFVAHGANDPALDPVNISTSNEDGTADCTTLIPEFAFGTTFPEIGTGADLAEGTLNIGFDVTDDMDACPQVGPVPVPVTAGVVSILVAVDENTAEGELGPELWAIVDASTTPIRLINAQ
jgi:hypothetical protein